ncbi:MAG: purine-nucleoside phosphorylase [Bacteroidetes bacterium]|nr:purine-nucleoside phosphorylase [Bacteroidota bacterium]
MLKKISETTDYLRSLSKFEPQSGIILGTGLGGLVEDIEIEHVFQYENIPNFPISTVESHHGKLIFGFLEDKKVVVMQGRFHYYEGYSMREVTYPVRILKALGIQQLLISNAAGGLNPDFDVSELMIIRDHINLQPDNPLRGTNYDELGPRFPDMSEPYDRELISKAKIAGEDLGIKLRNGVYAAVPGPNLETPAEYEYLAKIGADAVGMSTVPENIVARHMNLPCFAVSVITDMCVPGQIKKVTIEKVIEAAKKAEPDLKDLIKAMVK